jgi:2-aminomuconate deaminase|tara:strand:- start:21831 stop:22373 length:543 start_codon:yes stop_codon:yes gene_type:complete
LFQFNLAILNSLNENNQFIHPYALSQASNSVLLLIMSSTNKKIESNAPLPVGSYPMTRRVGNLIFMSGVGPRKPKSGTDQSSVPGLIFNPIGEIIDYDFSQQVHSVFANVKTILKESGCKWSDLVDITVYLTDMKRDFSEFNKIYSEYFQNIDNKPCRTTVEVLSLPTPIAIELKCIASL